MASLLALDMSELDKMPSTRLTQRHTVSSSAPTTTDASNASDQSTVYSGVLLRDVVARAGFGAPTDRGARVGVVEAVATDGYRAVFSWGELFNSPAGEHVLIVRTLNGRTLDEIDFVRIFLPSRWIPRSSDNCKSSPRRDGARARPRGPSSCSSSCAARRRGFSRVPGE